VGGGKTGCSRESSIARTKNEVAEFLSGYSNKAQEEQWQSRKTPCFSAFYLMNGGVLVM